MKKVLTGVFVAALTVLVSGCGGSVDSVMGELVQIQDEVADLASGMKDVAAVEAAKPKFEQFGKRIFDKTKKLLELKPTPADLEAASKKYEPRGQAAQKKMDAVPKEVQEAIERIMEEAAEKEAMKLMK